MVFFLFKQKTGYEMRISDWSSDVCSSDLQVVLLRHVDEEQGRAIDFTLRVGALVIAADHIFECIVERLALQLQFFGDGVEIGFVVGSRIDEVVEAGAGTVELPAVLIDRKSDV